MGAQIDYAARERAHGPYSKFAVNAALLSDSGEMYFGCDVENISYGYGQVAVLYPIMSGQIDDTVGVQVDPGPAIRAAGRRGVPRSWLLSKLLPSPFGDYAPV